MWFSVFGLLICHRPFLSSGARCETTHKADIIVLVDGSGSISQEGFETIQTFVTQIVNAFEIGPHRVQIGNSFTTTAVCLFICQIRFTFVHVQS